MSKQIFDIFHIELSLEDKKMSHKHNNMGRINFVTHRWFLFIFYSEIVKKIKNFVIT